MQELSLSFVTLIFTHQRTLSDCWAPSCVKEELDPLSLGWEEAGGRWSIGRVLDLSSVINCQSRHVFGPSAPRHVRSATLQSPQVCLVCLCWSLPCCGWFHSKSAQLSFLASVLMSLSLCHQSASTEPRDGLWQRPVKHKVMLEVMIYAYVWAWLMSWSYWFILERPEENRPWRTVVNW